MEIVNDNWFLKTDENNQMFSHKQELKTLKLVLKKKIQIWNLDPTSKN
jgi:hypothetical protein